MAYIGQQPVVGRYILLDQISGGFNGTATGFTMSTAGGAQGVIPGLAQNVLLSLGGVIQQPGVDYTISGSGLTFTTPPVSGTTFFATVLGDAQSVGTPSDGTVTPASIASGYDFAFPNLNVTGIVTIASGSAASPSLTITGDLNTGIYSPGADQVAISTNGTGRLFVDASGNVRINTSSAAANRLTVNEAVVGVSTPIRVQNASAGGNGRGVGLEFYGISNTFGRLEGFWSGTEEQVRLFSTGGTTFSTAGLERLRITSAGLVGIGTTSPDANLEVVGSSAGEIEVARFRIEGQTNNPMLRIFADEANKLLTIGTSGSTSGSVLRFNTKASTTESARIDDSGKLLVGTTTSQGSYNIQCYGTGVWGQGAYVNGSDANIKQNIQDLEPALDVIKAMRPVTFQYKEDYSSDQTVQPGFIAQELQQAMAGKAYVDGVVQQGTTHLNVAYSSIIAVLVKAVQELEAKVAALESA